jgi:uncharacterized coiled-coil protein SlyX
MVNLKKMQGRIDKLLSVFTNLVYELESAITELNTQIVLNEDTIENIKAENAVMTDKIKEYETLKTNVKSIVG